MRQYTVRRVNPFRGILRVLDSGDARALTVDALNWEVQMRVEQPAGWGSLNRGRTEIRYARHSVWSAQEGLTTYPLHPALNKRRMQTEIEGMVQTLSGLAEANASDFPLDDRYERWLLDCVTSQPLALLATASALPTQHTALHWSSTANDDVVFGHERRDTLDRLVSRRGGASAWFERQPDGSAVKVGSGEAAPSQELPELLLATQWPEDQAVLLNSYFEFQAPRLLMLPLAESTRARLEQAAASQPGEVAHFFRLYPAVVDAPHLNALRVQARLLQTSG